MAPSCRACGECCHFDKYGHTPYTSGLEVDYILHNAGRPEIAAEKGVCPYLVDNRCTVRKYRPLGCRTFYCEEGWKDTSSDIYEKYLRRIKGLYEANGMEWNYAEMFVLLDNAACGSSCVA